MASGDIVVHVLAELPPGTTYAQIDTRAGGSTPAEGVRVYSYDAGTTEYMDFLVFLHGYDGNGIDFTQGWSAASGTSNQIRIEMALRALPDDTEDIDSSHTYSSQGVSDTAPSASGELSYPTVSFSNAQIDSWADGEYGILRVFRDHDHADDTMTGDAQFWGPPIGVEATP
jgi:hypothetical protein